LGWQRAVRLTVKGERCGDEGGEATVVTEVFFTLWGEVSWVWPMLIPLEARGAQAMHT
jgi:hypothetical protein